MCPALDPVVTGTDPKRSRDSWPKNAQVKVFIFNDRGKDASFQFSAAEVQAIKDAFKGWQDGLSTCSGVQYISYTVADINDAGGDRRTKISRSPLKTAWR